VRSRRLLFAIVSAVLGAALVVFLVRLGKVDIHATLRQIRQSNRSILVELVLLNGILVWISTVKWRAIDALLRRPTDAAPSGISSFFVTSMGMALGLLLPVQLGMTISRTLGTHLYGRALKRGTGGTLLEQSFDLLIVLFLGTASLAVWFFGGHGFAWLVSATAVTALAAAAVEPWIRFMHWLFEASHDLAERSKTGTSRFSGKPPVARLLRAFADLRRSRLVSASLARRLVLLSAARFCVLVLMADRTAAAIRVPISLWRMGAAMPFATLANVVAITPGGIGVNELTSVAALHLFQVPLGIASEWAIANRLLVTGACFAVVLCAFLLLSGERGAGALTRISVTKRAGRGWTSC